MTRTAFRYSPSGFVSLISYQFLKSPFYPFCSALAKINNISLTCKRFSAFNTLFALF
nr:MAG TPA: hypothetical protein [Caudoviricetes sp.]